MEKNYDHIWTDAEFEQRLRDELRRAEAWEAKCQGDLRRMGPREAALRKAKSVRLQAARHLAHFLETGDRSPPVRKKRGE